MWKREGESETINQKIVYKNWNVLGKEMETYTTHICLIFATVIKYAGKN